MSHTRIRSQTGNERLQMRVTVVKSKSHT